jgi:Type I phosphodiesterase / nucleotide pyrophosphatase
VLIPAYGERCFADLPATVERLLGAGDGRGGLAPDVLGRFDRRWERVLLVLLDAFGWTAAERHAGHPFLRRASVEGAIARITSQFPSTTAAHATTIHTGLPLGASGVYEWFQHEPALAAVIAPLLFSFAGDAEAETLLAAGFEPAQLFPVETVYQRLAAAGVESRTVQPAAFAGNVVSRWLGRGAQSRPFTTLAQFEAELRAAVTASGGRYVYAYLDDVDTAGHLHGPASAEADAAATAALDALERLAAAGPRSGDTLLLVCADHGQVPVDPAATVFVNAAWPGIAAHLRPGRDGRPLAPAGSARDLFLHAAPGRIGELVAGLQRVVGDRATVHRTADLIDAGLFGDAGEPLLTRVGDVVVLPAPGESVWWLEPGRFEMRFRGHHGGATPDEMHVPLVAVAL